jgi:anti-sigma B factor antagonist
MPDQKYAGVAFPGGCALSKSDAISTSIAQRDGMVIVSVAGEIDLATAPMLETAVDEAIESGPAVLILDLSAVTFLASVGLQTLVVTHDRMSPTGRFAVVADGPATSRPIQLIKLDEMVALYPTVELAVADLGTE